MKQQQRKIVRDYINSQHKRCSEHLRSLGLLNNNGTLPRSEGSQINLERWFFDAINSDNYILSITDAGGVEASLEIGSFDSSSGNPVIFEFDAAAWPDLLEEAVLVEVDDGVANTRACAECMATECDRCGGTGWAEDAEPSIFVDICGESRNESYQNLFLRDDLGAIADIPGMTIKDKEDPATYADLTDLQKLVGKLIQQEKENLLNSVLQYGSNLVILDEDGKSTPESELAMIEWFDQNELTEELTRIAQSGVMT